MQALVFVDRPDQELLPLTATVPAALLPVVGRSLLEHTLLDLSHAGVRTIMLVAGTATAAVRRSIGDGARFGLRIRYVRSQPGETPTDVARRCAGMLPETYLALRADVLRGRCIAEFLAGARDILVTQVVGRIGGHSAALCLCRRNDVQLDILGWSAESPGARAGCWPTIDLGSVGYSRIDSPTSFYITNFDALDQRFRDLKIPGRALPGGVMAGDTELPAGVVAFGPVSIGDRCEISPRSELRGPVIVGDEAVIGDDVFIHSSIILPGAVVPRGLRLRNAVVTTEMAIGIDGAVITRFADTLGQSAGLQGAKEGVSV